MIVCVCVCSYYEMDSTTEFPFAWKLDWYMLYSQPHLLSRLFSRQFSMPLLCFQRYETPRGYLSSQIQQKKEELYDLIALADANSAASRVDQLLFRSLCTQVEPRPHDPQWYSIYQAYADIDISSVSPLLQDLMYNNSYL